MSSSRIPQAPSDEDDESMFLHMKEIIVGFDDSKRRPKSDIVVKFKDRNSGFESESRSFKKMEIIQWHADVYVKPNAEIVLTICQKIFIEIAFAKIALTFNRAEFGDNKTVERKGQKGCSLRLVFATSMPTLEVARALGSRATTALASKVSMLLKLESVLDFLNVIELARDAAQINPIAQVVVPIVSKTLAKFREVTSCHQKFIDIMNDLVLMLPAMEIALHRLQDPECLNIVKLYIDFTKETSEALISYASDTNAGLVIGNWYKSKKVEATRMKERSTQLKQNLELALTFDLQNRASDVQNRTHDIQSRAIDIQSTTSDVQITTLSIQRTQFRVDEESVLKRIKPPKLSSFDPDRCCLPETRTFVIDAVTTFAQSVAQPARLYWLYGIAGSGKSSIAASVAGTLYSRKRLAGAFFCKRDVADFRNPVNLIHALAYSIAEVYVAFKDIIVQALKEDSRIEDHALSLQCDALIKEPLHWLSQNPPPDPPQEPIVFVIDALDECDDNVFISLFISQMVELAPCLKFIVTSRPLPEIGNSLQQVERHTLTCDLFTQHAYQDIQTFIRSQFSSGGPLSDIESYVNDEQIERLAQKSSGLFIWITTVLSHVSRLLFGKHAAILDILSSDNASGPEAQLDTLYLQVLDTVTGSSPSNRHIVKFILALIFVTSRNQSLPSPALHAFVARAGIRVSRQELDSFLRQMGSVLMADMQTGAIRVCHPSFLDFVGSEARSKDFWTRTEDVDAVMAKTCLEIMETGLRFNICGLESATLRNDEVPDLKERIARHVPRELVYSCMYWFEHLSKGGDACKEDMLRIVETFLSQSRTLYWIEVLSLISELKAANSIIVGLRLLYKDEVKLNNTLSDYHSFLTLVHEPMSTSTPHIYTSSLLWAPSSSAISAHFYRHPLILEGQENDWPASLLVIDCTEVVCCVAYSPDGSRIVTGFDNGSIRIWDALSGAPVGVPLEGHRSVVRSVTCSPDGSHIVSGSDDGTIRIWDALSGTPIGAPLDGHKDPVFSVAFSPDGSRIISGSWDKTIRIWDVLSGVPIRNPLRGHSSSVHSVVYSTDGLLIVSGSHDRTVRIWDALSGVPIGVPLEGHTGTVKSVALSPDGMRIVSGSYDGTIRIWDTVNGTAVGSPLEGHTDEVNSVAYSPDGLRIISGSDDRTVRIWDASSSVPIGTPLRGDTGTVYSVAYSPDGSRIISGSYDGTVHVWDALRDAPSLAPLEGHRRNVNSVRFEHNGMHIVSGSDDGTIRIWDAASGAPIRRFRNGHTGWVKSVAYSPDGSRIVSSSSDKTIRICDAMNGTPLSNPLEGHTDWIRSIVYSPDGSRIASGSDDRTVRIWDARSGLPVGSALCGHTNEINSVAYSPDGSRIISGSDDGTVRIWDAANGLSIGEPLDEHTDPVHTVEYSPDGSRIISGSWDRTIRIWDAMSGVPTGVPLVGHTNLIRSVAFSPDGSRIVSGSDDRTIRIWDAANATPIGQPLKGHTDCVKSVAYSPDGLRIVSGSNDNTIRIWDAYPDENRRVCASDDGWIRTEDGGLLLWVPREFRNGVCGGSLLSIPHDAVGHPIKIDWKNLRGAWDRLNKEHNLVF